MIRVGLNNFDFGHSKSCRVFTPEEGNLIRLAWVQGLPMARLRLLTPLFKTERETVEVLVLRILIAKLHPTVHT